VVAYGHFHLPSRMCPRKSQFKARCGNACPRAILLRHARLLVGHRIKRHCSRVGTLATRNSAVPARIRFLVEPTELGVSRGCLWLSTRSRPLSACWWRWRLGSVGNGPLRPPAFGKGLILRRRPARAPVSPQRKRAPHHSSTTAIALSRQFALVVAPSRFGQPCPHTLHKPAAPPAAGLRLSPTWSREARSYIGVKSHRSRQPVVRALSNIVLQHSGLARHRLVHGDFLCAVFHRVLRPAGRRHRR